MSETFISEWATGLTWDVDEDGIVYMGTQDDMVPLQIAGTTLMVRPFVIGWTDVCHPALPSSWMRFELLFETEALEERGMGGVYRSDAIPALWGAMQVVSGHFPDYGVFLTDEFGNGRPFQGVVEGDRSKAFWFDLAIVPAGILTHFADRPEGCMVEQLSADRVAMANAQRWRRLPWISGH